MLLLVRVGVLARPLPRTRPVDLVAPAILRVARTLGALKRLGHQPRRARLLPAHAEHVHAVVELVVEAEMVEDVPYQCSAGLTASDAEDRTGTLSPMPSGHVEVVTCCRRVGAESHVK